MEMVKMSALSERALLVYVGEELNEQTHAVVQAAVNKLEQQQLAGIEEIIYGYTNFCIHFHPLQLKKALQHFPGNSASEKLQHWVREQMQSLQVSDVAAPRIVEIPVYYGGEYGPDLAAVAAAHQLTEEEVIQLHSEVDYLVHMIGFAPGFPFLGGLNPRIATPRHTTPRLKIAAGSVGIAGMQTGVYPFETPGGWQIIGRTMMPLFLPNNTPPTLLQAGDKVRFVPVKEESSC